MRLCSLAAAAILGPAALLFAGCAMPDGPPPGSDAGPLPDAPAAAPDAGPPPGLDAGSDAPPDAPAGDPLGLDCELDDAHRYACCVLDEVNAFRAETDPGLAPYVADPSLATVAFDYAAYMAERRVFAHSADGRSFGDRLDAYGVAWASAGENLQRNTLPGWREACTETVRGAGGWARSRSGHREAMLGQDASGSPRNWTHAAAGVARRGSEWYVAMYFVRY